MIYIWIPVLFIYKMTVTTDFILVIFFLMKMSFSSIENTPLVPKYAFYNQPL